MLQLLGHMHGWASNHLLQLPNVRQVQDKDIL